MRTLIVCLLCASSFALGDGESPSFPGAEGFGAAAQGGSGGKTLRVTSLNDDPDNPTPGTLRWAVRQPGPRIVHFDVAGTIQLKAPLRIEEPFLTIDGSDAPGGGVCLRDHSILIKSHHIIVRYLRIRRGDVETLKMIREKHLDRPKGSTDLDCVSIDDSSDILFDHCSLSWSNDEIFGIVRARNVSIQWCILSEPLSNPAIHPYGDHHAFGMNLSASTLSVHHCLIAHYVMRGPQFEANDVRMKNRFDVKFEAVDNVLFDYQRSGSRYTAGIEDHPDQAEGVNFNFQFINNLYLNPDGKRPEIEAELKHGVVDAVKAFIAGNIGPNRPAADQDEWNVLFAGKIPMRKAAANVQAQVAADRLFTPPIPVTTQEPHDAYRLVMEQAGCSNKRDEVDLRILNDVRNRKFGQVVHSQDDVGGWPVLK